MTGQEPTGTGNSISGGIFYGPVLQGRDIQATFHLPAAVPVALAQLPAATAGFTGRADELALLAGLLDPAGTSGSVLVSAVAGLAGVGKTTLAVQAGHAAQERGWFGGGVLFIDLHGYDQAPVDPGQALDALLRALGVPAEYIPPGTEARAGLYRSVLAEIAGPVLVIADNASSEVQVRLLLPGTGPHKALVTSRHTLAGLDARLVDVTVLDQADSVVLLDAALRAARPGDDRVIGDPDAAGRLAGACGGLPLALQIVAALLKADPTLGASDLADELRVERARLGRLRYDDGTGPSVPSVAAAFELSYRRLEEVPAQVFRLLPVNPGPDVSTDVAAILAGQPVGEARQVLAGLARAHLVEAAPAAGRWQMHDLLRLYALQLSDAHADADGREQARDRLLGYYLSKAGAADDHLRALTGMAVPGEFTGRDDALAWLDAERTSLVAAVTMAAEGGRDQAALRLPLMLAVYLDWRRRFDDWLATMTVSLNTARRLSDRHSEGTALNSLGVALREVRRFEEAITACQDAAAIFRETGDRHGEGKALTNLGVALREVRRFEEAITADQDAAAIFRETGDRHGEGNALNNLGAALQEVRRFEEAITADQDAATIYRETGDRHGQGIALNNLGAALQEVQRFKEAITAHQDAATIYRETGDRHGQGSALVNLGVALRNVGRFEEAITADQDAAAIFRETGDRHGEGNALNNLGNALQQARRFQEAISAHQDAAAIYRETGDRHGQGMALNSLGVALEEVRRFEEAITADQDAAAIFREIGDQHGEGIALGNLEAAQAAQQEYSRGAWHRFHLPRRKR
jgi:tetratricopeptide (TPR) repeat protein